MSALAPGAWQVLRADAPGPRRRPASLRTHVSIPRQLLSQIFTAKNEVPGRVYTHGIAISYSRRHPASLRTHVRIPRQSPKRACTARKKTGRVFARDSDQLSEKASCSTANSYQNPTTLTKTGLYREKGRGCTRNRN